MELVTYDFEVRGDERGSLIAIEEQRDIPFPIRRLYYIYGTQPGVIRGLHAHRQLQQVMVCLYGSCKLQLDDGRDQMVFAMESNARGVLIDRMVWHQMYDFSPDSVLLVLADDYYDEGDYIRDYQEFEQLAAAARR
ncbi:MAG: WxcM-like domain-containing protein [Syntrophomonadaceae bacterium]|nr:WxcM-like domain-containing protein [Syntrophomonadaceae bacterium]